MFQNIDYIYSIVWNITYIFKNDKLCSIRFFSILLIYLKKYNIIQLTHTMNIYVFTNIIHKLLKCIIKIKIFTFNLIVILLIYKMIYETQIAQNH